MIDGFSRFVQMAPISDHTAETVAKEMINKWISVFGFPTELYTDQGREFQSELMNVFCQKFEIAKKRTSPYHPQSNAVLERFHAQLGSMLRTYIDKANYKKWVEYLSMLALAHNTAMNRHTRFTPFELMFGRKCTMPLDLVLDLPNVFRTEKTAVQWVNEVRESIEKANAAAREHISEWQDRSKKIYDLNSFQRKYDIGTYVYKLDSVIQKGISKKLTPIYTGPFVIEKVNHPLYWLRTKRGGTTVIHHDRLLAAAPEYVPLVLKRQRANIIQNVLRSTRETEKLKKRLENQDKTKVKAEDILPVNLTPMRQTAAVKRPIGKIYQEYKAAKRRQKLRKAKNKNKTMIKDITKTADQESTVSQKSDNENDLDQITSDNQTEEPKFSRTGRRLKQKVMFDL